MLNGVTGAAEVPTVAVDSIEIGALKFEKQDLPVIFTSIMGNADGILGVAGFRGSAHRRRLQARPRERARIERHAGLTTAW